MALYVQLPDKKTKGELHHIVESFEDAPGPVGSSLDIQRAYKLGCGPTVIANGARMAAADTPPWTHRHVAKGCFTTAQDKES